MILDFDLADALERRISVYKALGSINTNPTVSAPCGAFSGLVGGLDVFILL